MHTGMSRRMRLLLTLWGTAPSRSSILANPVETSAYTTRLITSDLESSAAAQGIARPLGQVIDHHVQEHGVALSPAAVNVSPRC